MKRASWLVVLLAVAVAVAAAASAAGEVAGGVRERLRGHLDWERSLRELAPLAAPPALDAAAQARAEEMAAVGLAPRRDLGDHLSDWGYVADSAEQIQLLSAAPVERALSDLVDRGGALARVLLGTRYPDLGVGVARRGGVPLYLLIFALSAEGAFERRTAGLADREQVRAELLAETNRVRAARERHELDLDPCLSRVAQTYAERMLAEGFFDHVSPAGEEVLERVRAGGCLFRQAGENLAAGPDDAAAVVVGWLESAAHRRLLLSRDYRSVGFGIAHGPGAAGPEILWVQLLGAR